MIEMVIWHSQISIIHLSKQAPHTHKCTHKLMLHMLTYYRLAFALKKGIGGCGFRV